MTTEVSVKLITSAGTYEAPTLWLLFVEVMRHRLWHWSRGEGWKD